MHSSDSITILERLVAFDTTSRNSNLKLIDWATDYLSAFGARLSLTRDATGTKANLLAAIGPASAGGVVLAGHTDVVPVDGQVWTSDPFKLVERNGKLYGRGAADMKGYLACCLAAASSLAKAKLQRPVYLGLTYDEEIGCLGAPALVDDLVRNHPPAAFAIIGEPTDMHVATSHRGIQVFETRFKGKAAHSSNPDNGENAITAAAHFVTFLADLHNSPAMRQQRASVNVGKIEGGSMFNIVADHCKVFWEWRMADDAGLNEMASKVEAYHASTAKPASTDTLMDVPTLNSHMDAETRALLESFGGVLPPVTLPFGSEAGLFERAGIPAVVCGPGSITQGHKPDEFISIDMMQRGDAFLAALGQWLCRPIAA